MNKIFYLLIFFSSLTNALADSNQIKAIVGTEIITNLELNNRINITKLLMPEILDKINDNKLLSDYILQAIINEKLLNQEAAKLNITIDQQELNYAIANIESQNNIKAASFEHFISKQGLEFDEVINQITAGLIRQKYSELVLRPKVIITDKELDEIYSTAIPEKTQVNFKQLFLANNKIDDDYQLNKDFNYLNKFKNKIFSCNSIEELTKNTPIKVTDINLPLANINQSVRTMIKVLPLGNPSKIIKTSKGLYLVVVCNKDYIDLSSEDKEEISEILTQQKIERQAQLLMKELYKKVYIEIK